MHFREILRGPRVTKGFQMTTCPREVTAGVCPGEGVWLLPNEDAIGRGQFQMTSRTTQCTLAFRILLYALTSTACKMSHMVLRLKHQPLASLGHTNEREKYKNANPLLSD